MKRKHMKTGKSAKNSSGLKRKLADADIARAIRNDPDTMELPADFFKVARVVYPNGNSIVPVALDAKTTRWIAQHHMDYQTFLSGVMRAYVETQRKSAE